VRRDITAGIRAKLLQLRRRRRAADPKLSDDRNTRQRRRANLRQLWYAKLRRVKGFTRSERRHLARARAAGQWKELRRAETLDHARAA
jgi:hypothetical protein